MVEATAERAAPIVDGHAHIFTRAVPFAADAHSRPAYEYPVEAYRADLARHGLTHGVIAAASLYGENNSYTLEALAAYPAMLRGTVIVSPEMTSGTLRDLAERGVVGVRLVWRRLVVLPDLAADPWRTHLRNLADAGLHVELLAGGDRLPALLPALANSGVRVVLDHFGAPSAAQGANGEGMDAIVRAVAGGRLWVKLSAGYRLPFALAQACAARLIAEAGPERLLWGSDAPFVNHEANVDYAAVLALYRRLVPDARTRAAIDATALEFFFHERSQENGPQGQGDRNR
jgi:predicted TIM-barrel fold metal-dependent hydrolase